MPLPYGYVRSKVLSVQKGLKPKRLRHEIQYHLHASLQVGDAVWDVAINVGTSDADDLLQYLLVYDFHHPLTQTLAGAGPGQADLTGATALPALDFLRSDILKETGAWRRSDVMDGSDLPEPAASLRRLLERANRESADVYVFGRFYSEGDGLHDTHMNQGSTGSYLHDPRADGTADEKDHNDIWQDGAVIVNLGADGWAAYFAAFQQQLVPTDDLGNPKPGSRPIGSG
jgi:uncharacterized protein YukJ